MESSVKSLTLANLADGAADELWRSALARVLENVEDPNTDHKAKRTITLSFTLTVDEERRMGQIEIAVAAKLAGVKGIKVPVFLGRHEGQLTAIEAPRQDELFTTPAGRPRPVEAAGGAA